MDTTLPTSDHIACPILVQAQRQVEQGGFTFRGSSWVFTLLLSDVHPEGNVAPGGKLCCFPI